MLWRLSGCDLTTLLNCLYVSSESQWMPRREVIVRVVSCYKCNSSNHTLDIQGYCVRVDLNMTHTQSPCCVQIWGIFHTETVQGYQILIRTGRPSLSDRTVTLLVLLLLLRVTEDEEGEKKWGCTSFMQKLEHSSVMELAGILWWEHIEQYTWVTSAVR